MASNRKPKQRIRADGRTVTLVALWIESDLLDRFHAILEPELPTMESRFYAKRTPSRSEVHSRLHEDTLTKVVEAQA